MTKILLELKKKTRVNLSEFFLPFFSRWSNWIDVLGSFKAVEFQDVRCCYGAKSHIHRHPFQHIFISALSYTTLITNSLVAVHKHLHILIFFSPPSSKNAHHSSSSVINVTHYRLLQLSSNVCWIRHEEGSLKKKKKIAFPVYASL